MSISVKLMIATSIVVAAAVAMSSWVSVRTIGNLAQDYIQQRRSRAEESIARESNAIIKAMALAVSRLMIRNELADVATFLDVAVDPQFKRQTSSESAPYAQPRVLWLIAWDLDTYPSEDAFDKNNTKPVGKTSDAPVEGRRIAEIERALNRASEPAEVSLARISSDELVFKTQVRFSNTPVGVLWMGVSTAGIDEEVRLALRYAEQRARDSRRTVWLVTAGILLIGILLAAFQGISLARPIRFLREQATRIAGGDLSSRVPTDRGDELGALAVNFNFMADRIGTLLKEQAEKASLEREMSLARSVQQSMLPPHSVESCGHLKVVGYCAPASSCGGDWWMYRKLSGDRMLIVVGDATGHGIHSAMIAATARGAVEALAALDERLLTPDQVLRAIDSAIRNVGDHHVLMTGFSALFDSVRGTLQYANAGHNFPYIVHRGSDRALDDAVILATSGNPLGDREIPVEIRGGSRDLRPGDLFVCFTDGLVERADRGGTLFGDRRMLRVMRGQSIDGEDALVSLRERLVAAVESYADGEVASDDVTFVMCHYDPPAAQQRERRAGTA